MYSLVRAYRQEGTLALLTWSTKYSVGVQALDDQHKGLLRVLNALHAGMMKGQAQSVAGPLLDTLMAGARQHFALEERMMSEAKYAGLAQHRAKHQELIGKLANFMARYRNCDSTMYVQLLNFLRDWFNDHMQKEDQEYGPALKANGVR
jgi:hemerythrin-like metal-binding protein